eukprot:3033786-Prymnesium_polylepis.1
MQRLQERCCLGLQAACHTVSLASEAICEADRLRHVACLDHQHASVDEDEGQSDQRHQNAIPRSLERLYGEVKREERDADKDGYDHTRGIMRYE